MKEEIQFRLLKHKAHFSLVAFAGTTRLPVHLSVPTPPPSLTESRLVNKRNEKFTARDIHINTSLMERQVKLSPSMSFLLAAVKQAPVFLCAGCVTCRLLPGRLPWEDKQREEESAAMPTGVVFRREGPNP